MWLSLILVLVYSLLVFPIIFLYIKSEKEQKKIKKTFESKDRTISNLNKEIYIKEEIIKKLNQELKDIVKQDYRIFKLNPVEDVSFEYNPEFSFYELRISFEKWERNYRLSGNIFNNISLDFAKMIAEENVRLFTEDLIKKLTIQIYNARR